MQTTKVLGSRIDRRVAAIEGLDLTMVKRKLMEPSPEGKAWTQDQADEVELWYKRYLTIIAKYPEFIQVPNGPIDAFWHQHILDTRAYARDCQDILGRFLHHNPYFGLNGDANERDEAFDETNELYRKEFGEDCTSMKSFFGGQVTKGKDCNNGGENCGGSGCKSEE